MVNRLPKNQSVWSKITTKENKKFVMTYDVVSKEYYLYEKQTDNILTFIDKNISVINLLKGVK